MTLIPYAVRVQYLKAKQWLTWRGGLDEEIAYWDHWLKSKGDGWVDDYERKTNARTELFPHLSAELPQTNAPIAILDVGSGPITGIGFIDPQGRKLRVEAADPLAKAYGDLLERHNVTPPVRTSYSPAEKLSHHFEEGEFQLVHCRNALDHSYDPMTALREMLKVTADGGAIVLDHYINEAKHTSYIGLHQWNMDYQNGRFVIWNPGAMIDVQDELGSSVEIKCEPYTIGRDWIRVVIRKSVDRAA